MGRYAALWRAQSDHETTPAAPQGRLRHGLQTMHQQETEDRRILTLYMEGFGECEIAETLGIFDRKVRRILERLRGRVEQEGFHGFFRSLSRTEQQAVPAGVE